MGAAGAVAVGALAVGAVAPGAPVAAVTGVLAVLAVAGGAALGYDTIGQIRSGNWAGVAYHAGSVAGGAAVGGAGGRFLAQGINGVASPAWSWASDLAQGYLNENRNALVLDALSLLGDAFGPEEQYAKLTVGLTLSSASAINSAAHQDMTGTALGMGSYLKAPTELAATSAGWGWAKWIPYAGAAADVYSAWHDVSEAKGAYNKCILGH